MVQEMQNNQLPLLNLDDEGKKSELSVHHKEVRTPVVPREKWSNKLEFVFACVGFAVGYGNFWRFPYKCFKNGGGAFLIPFVICLVLAGIPLFILELALGQFTQSGPVKAWTELCPLASGIGYGMVVVCAFVSVYYNVVLAWSCYYFFSSFLSNIPWVTSTTSSGNSTPTAFNRSLRSHEECGSSCLNHSFSAISLSQSAESNRSVFQPAFLSREFYINTVLQMNADINQTGGIVWETALCLVLAWVLVYFCVWKGVRTTGKVVYVTATLPYIILILFAIRGCSLHGAGNGIRYYVTPVWDKLTEPGVWVEAASQVFYSLTLGFGVMLLFSSYNQKSNNVYRDAIIISVSDALTSVFSGFVVFAILGYLADIQGKDLSDASIATDGPGLVFIVYPAALATLSQPRVWSILFFLMLISLGLDSQFGQVELICVAIMEQYPKRLRQHKEMVTLAVCIVLCLAGLVCTTKSGMYWFHLMDTYSAGYSLLFLGLMELLVVSWCYGADRFHHHIEHMIAFRISHFWMVMWKYVTPLITLALLLFGLANHRRLTYEGLYTYPLWAEVVGWTMCLGSIACVPFVALMKILKARGSLTERLRVLTFA